MGKGEKKLSDTYVKKSSLKAGHHSDGRGLYLIVRKSGSKSWSYVWIKKGKRREMGLGGYPNVTLAQARKNAAQIRTQIAAGLDPFIERDREAPKTFGQIADLVLVEKEKGWTKPKHGANWRRSLNHHCEPIRDILVSTVSTAHVVKVLKPIFERTPETGRQTRYRIEYVLDYATTLGMREGDNPARWRGHLKTLFGTTKRETKKHFAAMPYSQIPEFMTDLRDRDAMAAFALEFTILTCARTSETLEAQWPEINLDDGLWTVPAARMKMKREHAVPLSDRVLEILNELYPNRTSDKGYVFPGARPNRPLSNMSMNMLLRRMKIENATTHGFRSTFRDYAGDCTSFSREVAEAALSHAVGDAVERSYRRSDALEKRRALMQAWADYCFGEQSNEVVRIHG